jgi:hypothetical protein
MLLNTILEWLHQKTPLQHQLEEELLNYAPSPQQCRGQSSQYSDIGVLSQWIGMICILQKVGRSRITNILQLIVKRIRTY